MRREARGRDQAAAVRGLDNPSLPRPWAEAVCSPWRLDLWFLAERCPPGKFSSGEAQEAVWVATGERRKTRKPESRLFKKQWKLP